MVLGIRLTHGYHRGSVLPHVATVRAREDTRLVVARTSWKDLTVLTAIFIFLIFFLGLLVSGWLTRVKELQALGGAVMMAGGLFELGRRYLNQRRIQSAAIVVRPWPIRLGENATVTFSSSLKNASVVARLLCIEETKHSMGKYETVKRAIRFQLDIVDTSGDVWEFATPVSGLPSLAVRSNKVQWIVRTMITTEKLEIPADFEFLVIPEIVS